MSKIDKRIVEMEFRNGQFNSGVESTSKAMEKLKGALDTSGVAGDVEKISSKFNLLGAVGFAAINKITASAISMGAKVMSNVINPIVQGGQKRSLNLEQSRFQLMGLLHDTAEVEKVMDDVNYAVSGTAYGLDSAAMAASSLAASNIKAGDNMKNYLRGISGIAAMTGSSYEDVSNIFTKIAGQTRVMGDDFRRLEARGMNAAAAIGEHFGYTEAEVREMATKGKISADMFAEAMNTMFGEHATKANETYAGSLSNVKAALARIGETFYLGIDRKNPNGYFERQRLLFVELIPLIDKIKTAISPVMEAFNSIKMERRLNLTTNLKNFVDSIDMDKVTLGMENFGQVIHNVYDAVMSFIQPIGEAFKDVFGWGRWDFEDSLVSISEKLMDFTAKLKLSGEAAEFVKYIFTGFFEIIKGGIDLLKKLGSAIKKGFSTLFEGFDGFDGSAFFKGFKDIFSVLGKLGSGLLKGIGPVLQSIANGLGTLLTTVATWLKENVSVSDIFAILLGGGAFKLGKKLSGLFDTVSDGLDKFFSIFGNKDGKQVSQFSGVLQEISGAIGAFTKSLNIASLVMVAGSIFMLAHAVKTLSEIDVKRMIPAIAGLGALFAMLTTGMRRMSDVMTSIKSLKLSGMMGFSMTMLAFATSLRILASALKVIAELNFTELATGLIGMFGVMKIMEMYISKMGTVKFGSAMGNAIMMVAFALTLRSIAKTLQIFGEMSIKELAVGLSGMLGVVGTLILLSKKMDVKASSIKSAVMMVAFAIALRSIAKTLQELGSMHPKEILTGLSGMLGVVIILNNLMKHMSKMDKGSIGSAISILIVSFTLGKIARVLQDIGSMTWGEIAKGLTGIGSALVAMAGTLKLVDKVSTSAKRSIAGASAILIVSFTLGQIVEALDVVAKLSLEDLLKGVLALSAMLSALGGAILLVSRLGGEALAALAASASILLLSFSLSNIAKALIDVSVLDWNGVGVGLVGLGVALGIMSGVLYLLASDWKVAALALVGAGSLYIASLSLVKIAEALSVLGSMSWGEIGHGITAMLGTFATLAVASVIGAAALPGALALAAVAKPLGEMAESVKKWGDLKVPSDFSRNMKRIADGVMHFTWARMGAWGLSSSAKEIGVLGDSISKWADVKVPPSINYDMQKLAEGVKHFSWAQFGGWGLSTSASALGVLGESVSKWSDVKVPDNIGRDMHDLASGVLAFSFTQIGGWGMNIAGPALESLADGVGAFDGVSIPDGISDDLIDLSTGIKSFTWAFMGGWSLGTIVGPFKELAEGVQLWSDVEVPPSIESDLQSLARGIGAFQWSFFTGGNIDSIAGPFGVLAESTAKWSEVDIPSGLGDDLEGLAKGIGAFQWKFFTGGNLDSIAGPFGVLADSTAKWSEVDIPSSLGDDLESLARGISAFQWKFFTGGNLDSIAGPFGVLAESTAKWKDVVIPEDIGDNLGSLARGISAFQWKFFTGGNLDSIAGPFGLLAESTAKWKDVVVPEDIGDNLESLARGVSAFQWKFFTGGNLDSIAGPFGTFADSVKKWEDVTVPSTIEQDLIGLSTGVNSFGGFFNNSGDKLATVTGPLGELAEAVKLWEDVSIPSNLPDDLEGLSAGLDHFGGFMKNTGDKLGQVTGPLRDMAESVQAWDGVVVPIGLGDRLSSFGEALKGFVDIVDHKKLGNTAGPVSEFASAVSAWSDVSVSISIGVALETLADGLEALSNATISSDVAAMLSDISAELQNLETVLSPAIDAVDTWSTDMTNAFDTASSNVVSAIGDMSRGVASSIRSMVSSVVAQIRSLTVTIVSQVTAMSGQLYSGGYTAGLAISRGLAAGISSGGSSAISAASRVAYSALSAAKAALSIHSPSKAFQELGIFAGEGLALGLLNSERKVESSAKEMSESALRSTMSVVDELQDLLDAGLIDDPVITPVLDLDPLRRQVFGLEGVFNTNTTLGLAESAQQAYENNRELAQLNDILSDDKERTEVTFNQYNTSPKALNATDIYRRTRNQLAIVKKGLPL